MSGKGRIDVISCGTGLPAIARELASRADHVYGSQALLALLGDVAGQTHAIRARAREDASTLAGLAAEGATVAVLASGDALYHGIGGTLADVLANEYPDGLPCALCFHPGVTAFQTLFHTIGLPWTGARLFSAHWSAPPLREMLEARLAVIYGGTTWPATRLAAALLELSPSSGTRLCVLAEDLGRPTEHVAQMTLAEAARQTCGHNSILVLRPEGAAPLALALGLGDEHYAFEAHLITAPEVRAVALSRLRLPSFGAVWDLGAGSGSVGIEAAALRPGCAVIAVEKNPARCAMAARNARAMGVSNHRLVEADITAFLEDAFLEEAHIPAPDRVFVGGGGTDLARIVERACRLLRPGGLLVASAVTMESVAALTTLLPALADGCVSLDIGVSKPLGPRWRQLSPRRRIHLFTFRAACDGPAAP